MYKTKTLAQGYRTPKIKIQLNLKFFKRHDLKTITRNNRYNVLDTCSQSSRRNCFILNQIKNNICIGKNYTKF